MDLRPINSDINKSDIVWYDDTLKESLARDYSAVRKRTRRGTKGNKRRHNTRTRPTIERPSSNQVIKRANSKEKTVGTSLKQPNILLANCQSLASGHKSDELALVCRNNAIEIILATETWFKNTKDVNLPEYKLYSTHRISRGGGGTAVYVKQDIPSQQLHKFTYNDKVSATWVKVSAHPDLSAVIYGCIHHPPDACCRKTQEYLISTLTSLFVDYWLFWEVI